MSRPYRYNNSELDEDLKFLGKYTVVPVKDDPYQHYNINQNTMAFVFKGEEGFKDVYYLYLGNYNKVINALHVTKKFKIPDGNHGNVMIDNMNILCYLRNGRDNQIFRVMGTLDDHKSILLGFNNTLEHHHHCMKLTMGSCSTGLSYIKLDSNWGNTYRGKLFITMSKTIINLIANQWNRKQTMKHW